MQPQNMHHPVNPQESAMRRYFQRRLQGFATTMIVMGLSFLLYYLGFFGGVEGPLEAGRLGDQLASLGVGKSRLLMVFLSVLVISLAWNWIYNLYHRVMGGRLTCQRQLEGEHRVCGAKVVRIKIRDEKTGARVKRYVCQYGHQLRGAHFHPVRKGAWAHTIWVASALLCAMFVYYY